MTRSNSTAEWLASFAWLALWAALVSFSPPLHADETTEVIEACIQASGGYEAITAIKGLRRSGIVIADMGGAQLTGSTELTLVPWRKINQYTDLGITLAESGWNGEFGWEDGAQGLRDLDEAGVGLLRLQASLHPLVGYQAYLLLGMKMDLEKEAQPGVDSIRVETDANASIEFLVNRGTRLLDGLRINRRLGAQGMTFHVNIDYSDYESFGGVRLPKKTTLRVGSLFSYEIEYHKTEINPVIDPGIFEKPQADKPQSPAPRAAGPVAP